MVGVYLEWKDIELYGHCFIHTNTHTALQHISSLFLGGMYLLAQMLV